MSTAGWITSVPVGQGRRFLRLDPPEYFTSIFACQGDHDSSAERCMQTLKPYLQPFVRHWSSYSNERRRLQPEEHSAKKLQKVVLPFFCQHPMIKTETKTKRHDNSPRVFVLSGCILLDTVFGGRSDIWSTNLGCASVRTANIRPPPQTISYTQLRHLPLSLSCFAARFSSWSRQ